MRALQIAAAGMALLLVSTQLGAQSTDDQARTQFKRGIELFQEGKFEQASMAFERAYELKPSYKILFNIGQVENELGHYAAALVAYSRYLDEGGGEIGPERIEQVNLEIERLNSLVGTIVVECAVEGAKVKVDNEARGMTPLGAPIFVDLGKHEVVIQQGRRELFNELVKVGGGERVVVTVEADPAEQPETAGTPAEEQDAVGGDAEESGQGDRVWTWVALGVGGAAGIAGGVIGGVSMGRKSSLLDACEDGHCPPNKEQERDSIKSMGLAADVLFGVAAAGVVTGVILFFVEPGMGEEETVAVAPLVVPGGGGLAAGGRF